MDVDACGLDVNSPKPIKCLRCNLNYPENLPICPKCKDLSDKEALKLEYELPYKVRQGNKAMRILLIMGAITCFLFLIITFT